MHTIKSKGGRQADRQPINQNMSPERLDRLEESGFKGKLQDHHVGFERHCCDLEVFQRYSWTFPCALDYTANSSLGRWCTDTRDTYRKIQKGEDPRHNLSSDGIKWLEELELK